MLCSSSYNLGFLACPRRNRFRDEYFPLPEWLNYSLLVTFTCHPFFQTHLSIFLVLLHLKNKLFSPMQSTLDEPTSVRPTTHCRRILAGWTTPCHSRSRAIPFRGSSRPTHKRSSGTGRRLASWEGKFYSMPEWRHRRLTSVLGR